MNNVRSSINGYLGMKMRLCWEEHGCGDAVIYILRALLEMMFQQKMAGWVIRYVETVRVPNSVDVHVRVHSTRSKKKSHCGI